VLDWTGLGRVRTLGTFAISATAGLGAAALTLVTPVTSTLVYDRLQPDGRMAVRLIFDHRVYDGGTAARALTEMEDVLRGQIRAELRDAARQAA
jgi:pyruvate/2-oxoglutarate dehydrogenase complex dihydrolipoamide acyltransferase (E2) component